MAYGGGLENRWALKGSAGSNPALTALFCLNGEIGRRATLKMWFRKEYRFDSCLRYKFKKMKILKSTNIIEGSISDLPHIHICTHVNKKDREGMWAAVDESHNLMYLLNDALSLYPYSSWGLELPLKDEINLYPYLMENDPELIFCEEAYQGYYDKGFLKEDGTIDVENFKEKFWTI